MDDFDMGLLDDTSYKVNVLRQKMLGIAPVFMYRVPKEKAAGQEYLYVDRKVASGDWHEKAFTQSVCGSCVGSWDTSLVLECLAEGSFFI
jgi:hypothetical protein